jgi:hypothetical protein
MVVDGSDPKGTGHDIERTATVRDVRVRTSDGWRRQSHTKIVANTITAIEGKPFFSPP